MYAVICHDEKDQVPLILTHHFHSVIVDFPDKAAQNKFLNQEELDLIKNRINKDRGDAEFEKLTWPLFFKHIIDPKIWAFALLFMGGTMPSYALAYFVPTILGTLGYSNRDSQILSAPPYVVAVPIAFTGAYLSDKFHNRSIVICFNAVMCLVGLVLVGYHTVGSVSRSPVTFHCCILHPLYANPWDPLLHHRSATSESSSVLPVPRPTCLPRLPG